MTSCDLNPPQRGRRHPGLRFLHWASPFWQLWHSLQAILFSFLPFVAFGTGEGLLRYGIRIRCSKRLPVVRDAFSEALRAQNRLLRYGRNIRYRKPPSLVRIRHSCWPRFEDAAECWSRFEDTAECWSRFEDATVVGVVPVAAAMDLLA